MELKIGEIFKHDGSWYQCVIDNPADNQRLAESRDGLWICTAQDGDIACCAGNFNMEESDMIEENTNRFVEAFAQADAAFNAQYPEVVDAVDSIAEAVDIPSLWDIAMQIEQTLESVAQMIGGML